MHTVTLKQLRYFDAIARHLHFGRAAAACCVTQPALSMQIQELEAGLNCLLLERARSGLKLTAIGELIAQRAARVLADVDDIVAHCQHASGVLTGQLRLGVIPSIAPYLVPPLLAILKTEYPDLKLHVRETQTRILMEELLEGKLDVLLLALPLTGTLSVTDITTRSLFEDRLLLAVPAQFELTGAVRATRDMVANERLLLLEEGHCLRDQALTFCDLQPVTSINTLGVSSLSTVMGMVAAGHGITLLPELCVEIETRGREIGLAAFVEPEPFRTVGLAWRVSNPRGEDFEELGRLLNAARPVRPAL
jgi:LysR family transcriptional regulator, hydrogen peroxide-inducible genes activator